MPRMSSCTQVTLYSTQPSSPTAQVIARPPEILYG